MAMLDRTGLKAHKGQSPGQLHGGQQHAAITRALRPDPTVMLIGKPSSALNPKMVGEALNGMVQGARDGITMMVVAHERGLARKLSHRVIFIDAGTIVEGGNKTACFGDAGKRTPRASDLLARILGHRPACGSLGAPEAR